MTQSYYQTNREKILQKAKERHEKNKNSNNYKQLTNARKKVIALRDSLTNYRKKIQHLQNKLKRVRTRVETFELAWGKERAQRRGK